MPGHVRKLLPIWFPTKLLLLNLTKQYFIVGNPDHNCKSFDRFSAFPVRYMHHRGNESFIPGWWNLPFLPLREIKLNKGVLIVTWRVRNFFPT